MPQFNIDEVLFFSSHTEFRNWLEKNYHKEKELWVSFYKKETKKPSLTRSQSVDEALCIGWIDGVRKSIDFQSYTIRFTPQNPKVLDTEFYKINYGLGIFKIETSYVDAYLHSGDAIGYSASMV